jgi:3-oxoadipate enol-lactonase
VNNPTFVTTNGVSLRCQVVGGGPPLCLINGFRLHGSAWPECFVERLAKHFSVVTYDARGTGLSDKPTDDYAVATMARDAAELITELGFQKAHVLGFSMGGMVAQDLAIRHPQRVHRLVLFATYAGFGFTIPAPWSVQRRLYDIDGLLPEDAAKQVWPVTYTAQYLSNNQSTVEAQMRREIAYPTPDYVARGLRTGLRAFSSGFRLWRLRARTLVVTGTEDQLVPPGNSRILASAIPDARLESLPGLGHRAIWEAPEEIADLVSDFLTIRELSPARLSLP